MESEFLPMENGKLKAPWYLEYTKSKIQPSLYLRIILIDDLSILSNLFLSWKHRIVQLNRNILVFNIELPQE